MAPKLKAPADDVLAAVATEHSLAFEALAADSSFVKLHMRMANAVSGLTSKAMVPSCLAASDCALGAIQLDFVTEVDERGSAINVASNISSAQTANVAPCVHSQPARTQSPQPALHAAPPLHDSLFYASFVASRVGSTGSAKTFTMNIASRSQAKADGKQKAALRGITTSYRAHFRKLNLQGHNRRCTRPGRDRAAAFDGIHNLTTFKCMTKMRHYKRLGRWGQIALGCTNPPAPRSAYCAECLAMGGLRSPQARPPRSRRRRGCAPSDALYSCVPVSDVSCYRLGAVIQLIGRLKGDLIFFAIENI